jgi:hypothetical protein
MQLTFLEHQKTLSKTFTEQGPIPYPRAKAFTSHTESFQTPDELFDMIIKHADKGHCLLQGHLTEAITQESRAGKADKAAQNRLMAIDIDKLHIPNTTVSSKLSTADITKLSELIVSKLPQPFRETSYVVQASASLGRNRDDISLHLFFIMAEHVPYQYHKLILQNLNFCDETFESNLKLTPNGSCMQYPVDVCLAQPSRIVYIAPPIYEEPLKDPITGDRIILVKKEHEQLSTKSLLHDTNPAAAKTTIDSKIAQLRKDAGLKRKTHRYTSIKNPNSEKTTLLLNPDPCILQEAYVNGDFVYFNINGGDSNAYYTNLKDPGIVYNFKEESAFKIQDVDPEFYEEFLLRHQEVIGNAAPSEVPFVFRDIISGKHYNGLYDAGTEVLIDCYPAQKGDLEEYMVFNHSAPPEVLPSWKYIFNPQELKSLHPKEKWVNSFMPTALLLNDTLLSGTIAEGLGYNTSNRLQQVCPNIFKIIMHMMNSNERDFNHFMNWLAFIFQKRDKTKTAWIFSGVPGTGKGVFFANILFPILNSHTSMVKLKDIKDNFQGFLATDLITVVDEFCLGDSQERASEINSWLKNTITESHGIVRIMRTDPVNIRNYCNLILCSNQYDPMKIEEGDRRFNVAERQETKIVHKYPDIWDTVEYEVPLELPNFVAFMKTYCVDEKAAQVALETDAKYRMYKITENTIDEFARAIRGGDLDYFVEQILEQDKRHSFENQQLRIAKQVVKRWIESINNPSYRGIHVADLVTVFNAISPKKHTTTAKLPSMLSHYGIDHPQKRLYANQKKRAGWPMQWKLNSYKVEELKEDYFDDLDLKTPDDKILDLVNGD